MNPRTVRSALAVLVLPAALALGSWLVIRTFVAELPQPVATHWGASGAPDGFSSPGSAAATTGLLAGGFGVGLGLVIWALSRKAPMVARGAGAFGAGMAGFIGGLGVASLWVQRGLTDARQATEITGPMGVGLGIGLLSALVGGLLMPGEVPGAARAVGPVPNDAPRIDLGASERAVWMGWAHSPALLYVAIGSALGPLVVLGVLGVAVWPILAVIALTAVLLVSTATFRVTVGIEGLWVRSIVGWPRFHVPLEEVAHAEVVEVSPMREFGGWGLRGDLKGRFGVVLRKGPALEVTRGDKSRFVVTVDEAAVAAGLLNTLADRQRPGAFPG
ncbi:MAG: DUF1648 domain-containing protein [Actinobacteria bacterium]|nr:DUF1648 domain-containing protein [Actinomycetota bacterium]